MDAGGRKLFLIRHAESEHNAYQAKHPEGYTDPHFWDASITQGLAIAQIEELKPKLVDVDVDLFIVSPFTRAIQTLLKSFQSKATDGKIPVIVHHFCRESLSNGCDVGTPLSELKKKFPYPHFDYSPIPSELWWYIPPHLEEGEVTSENYKDIFLAKRWREPKEELEVRAQKFKEWLHTLSPNYKRIYIVSHSGFLMALQGLTEKMPNCSLQEMNL